MKTKKKEKEKNNSSTSTRRKKQLRKADLLFYEDLIKSLSKINKMRLLFLIARMNYGIETNQIRNEQDALYEIVGYLKLTPRKLKKELVSYKLIATHMWDMTIALRDDHAFAIDQFLNDKKIPERKKWFVDRFGEAAERYLPDWKNHRGQPPKPDFDKSYEIFSKHATRFKKLKELGVKSYRTYRYRTMPYGKLELLFLLHKILYSMTDEAKALLQEKKTKIMKILDGLSDAQVMKVIDAVKEQYSKNKYTKAPPAISRKSEIYKIIYLD